jgi:predicted nucleic acid-binding protein
MNAAGRLLRLYLDTAVYGGCFEPEFAEHSLRLFSDLAAGRATVLISDLVLAELQLAPPRVRAIFDSIPAALVVSIPLAMDVDRLSQAYLDEGIVSPRSLADATHVAAATVGGADAIVSWNFRHIVSLKRMKEYNRINLLYGYGVLRIVSPREVSFDE